MIEWLGADPDVRMENGSTALHMLAVHSKKGLAYESAIAYLVRQPRVNVDLENSIGVTSLELAIEKGSDQAVRLLLAAGSSVSRMNADGDASLEELLQDKKPDVYKGADLKRNRRSPNKSAEEELFDILYYEDKQSGGRSGKFESAWAAAEKNNNASIDADFDNGTYTFLQYACDQGMDGVAGFLLDKGADPNKCAPNYQFPPLVIAGHHGYHRIVRAFKDRALVGDKSAVDMAATDSVRQETVLHKVLKAESRAHANYAGRDYDRCLAALLDDNSKLAQERVVRPLVDAQDRHGNPPLKHAVQVGNERAQLKLLRAGANIGIKNVGGQTPIDQLPPNLLEGFLDECLQGEGLLVDENFKMTFSYTFLGPPFSLMHPAPSSEDEKLLEDGSKSVERRKMPEAEPLWYLSQSKKHRDLLLHPVVSSFLCLKWRLIRPYYYVNLAFYLLFVALLTAHLLLEAAMIKREDKEKETADDKAEQRDGLRYAVVAFYVLFVCRELFQALVSFRRYLFSLSSLPKIALASVLLAYFCLPAGSDDAGRCLSGAALLLSWAEMVFTFGRHPKCSTYITMFKTVSLNFFLFLTWYISFIIAFGLAFFIVLPLEENDYFATPGKSLLKTVVMALAGELEFEGIKFGGASVAWFSVVVFLAFVFFIMLVLVNLLNGLAVSDIGVIQKQSEIVALTSRVELVSYIESMLLGDPFQFLTNWPPVKLLRQLPACDCFRKLYAFGCVRTAFATMMGNTLLFQSQLPEKKAVFQPNLSYYENNVAGSALILDDGIVQSAMAMLGARAGSNDLATLEKGMKLLAQQQQYIIELLQKRKN